MNSAEKFVHYLQRSQWFTPEEIAERQRPLLERLLRHAATQTVYYRDTLAPLFGGGDPAVAPVDWSAWQAVPVLKRLHAAEVSEQLTARSVPQEMGPAKAGQSSGTTGKPFRHLRSQIAIVAANCTLDRIYEVFELDMTGSLAMIVLDRDGKVPFPEGGRFMGWNQSYPHAELFSLGIETSTANILDWLERMRPDHVMTYPGTLAEVARLAQERSSGLGFKTFLSSGEMLEPDARIAIEAAFGCRSIDIYGARECGTIAFQCPEADGFHACTDLMHFELLDDSDRPVPPGTFGRVVVTTFFNFAMPLIRYDIGDYARAAATPCGCGRGLPLLDAIGGRTRNLFIQPDGSRRRVSGGLVSDVAKLLPCRQVQIVQAAIDGVEVRYVPDGTGVQPDREAIASYLRSVFHPAIGVRVTPVERIERSTGMKIEQFVSRVQS